MKHNHSRSPEVTEISSTIRQLRLFWPIRCPRLHHRCKQVATAPFADKNESDVYVNRLRARRPAEDLGLKMIITGSCIGPSPCAETA